METEDEIYDLLSKASRLRSEEQASRSLDAMRRLHAMTQDHTLRDYDWTIRDVYNPLFSMVSVISDEQSLLRGNFDVFLAGGGEVLMWQIVRYMLECPHEFNSEVAAKSDVIDDKFVEVIVDRMANLAVGGVEQKALGEKRGEVGGVKVGHAKGQQGPVHDGPPSDAKVTIEAAAAAKRKSGLQACVNAAKLFLHWLYLCRVDLRAYMRIKLCNKVLWVGKSCSKGSSVAFGPLNAGIGRDGGSARFHIKPLLEILHCVIDGLDAANTNTNSTGVDSDKGAKVSTFSSASSFSALSSSSRRLLTHVLLPLHTPSDFVEWRDQQPVIGHYHEILVRCIIRLLERERESWDAGGGASRRPSFVMIETVRALLRSWPGGHNANSPKEVLFLHELEIFIGHMLCQESDTEQARAGREAEGRGAQATPGRSGLDQSGDVVNAHPEALVLHKEILFRIAQSLGRGPSSGSCYKESAGVGGVHVVVAQRTLSMFKSAKVLAYLSLDLPQTLRTLLPALYPHAEVQNNPDGGLSWNPTLNRMLGLTLTALRDLSPAAFDSVAEELFGSESPRNTASDFVERVARDRDDHIEDNGDQGVYRPSKHRKDAATKQGAMEEEEEEEEEEEVDDTMSMPPPKFAPGGGFITPLDQAANDRAVPAPAARRPFNPATVMPSSTSRPPLGGGGRGHRRPPLGGIAPGQALLPPTGRTGGMGGSAATTMASLRGGGSGLSTRDSMTITGVAPWAQVQAPPKASNESDITGTSKRFGSDGDDKERGCKAEPTMDSDEKIPRGVRHRVEGTLSEGDSGGKNGAAAVREFMARCLPRPVTDAKAGDTNKSGSSSAPGVTAGDWNAAQAAWTPTILSSLRFHDLVFGYATLGRGTFSTVRYARHITSGVTQRDWPEYAVKVVDREKLESMDYHKAVEREMSTLQLQAHPGICRLISSFAYKQSAYIVLEYCARGDLHGLVTRLGRLSVECSRFVVGQAAAALLSIHDNGFAFNDLKPENLLITALGHIKLCDFGACRPVSAIGRRRLGESWRALSDLRNGDWKDHDNSEVGSKDEKNDPSNPSPSVAGARIGAEAVWTFGAQHEAKRSTGEGSAWEELDTRVEGTPAYLPPEVLNSDTVRPGLLSDAWALGCVAAFCLVGRPLFYGSRGAVQEQQVDFGTVFRFGDQDESENEVESTKSGVKFGRQEGYGLYVQLLHEHATTSGDDQPARERSHEREFLRGLLHPEPSERVSVGEACRATFLLEGDTLSSASGTPLILDPLKLHSTTTPVVQLPRTSSRHQSSGNGSSSGYEGSHEDDGKEEGGEDNPWARRQFSVLWAPMPADYEGNDKDDGAGARAPESQFESQGSSMGGPRRAYRMTRLYETPSERNAPFLR